MNPLLFIPCIQKCNERRWTVDRAEPGAPSSLPSPKMLNHE
jgi:hypothetical protein